MLQLHHPSTVHHLGDVQVVASRAGVRVCIHGKQWAVDGNLHKSYAEKMLPLPAARALHAALGSAIAEVAGPRTEPKTPQPWLEPPPPVERAA